MISHSSSQQLSTLSYLPMDLFIFANNNFHSKALLRSSHPGFCGNNELQSLEMCTRERELPVSELISINLLVILLFAFAMRAEEVSQVLFSFSQINFEAAVRWAKGMSGKILKIKKKKMFPPLEISNIFRNHRTISSRIFHYFSSFSKLNRIVTTHSKNNNIAA